MISMLIITILSKLIQIILTMTLIVSLYWEFFFPLLVYEVIFLKHLDKQLNSNNLLSSTEKEI